MANGGTGAGREVQVVAKNSGRQPEVTWEECNGEVLSGKRQGVARLPQGRTYYHNGIATPKETFDEKCKLNRMRVAARMTRLNTNYNRLANVQAKKQRLDPDEFMNSMSQPPETANLKPIKEMNEYSCYLCQRPMKTVKQLVNHVQGGKHREVFAARQRNEKGYGYSRDNPGHCKQVDQEPEIALQRPTRKVQHKRERYASHQDNRYSSRQDNRVNEYIGPGPDCGSENYDQEPPDDPWEDDPYEMYISFQSAISPTPPHELNPMTRLIKVENGDAPNVMDITPDLRMLTPTPTTEDLVRRFGDGWRELKEG